MQPTTLQIYYTVPEAAEVARVKPKTVMYWVYAGLLPATKRGKHRLIRRDVLERWLEGGDVSRPVAVGGAR